MNPVGEHQLRELLVYYGRSLFMRGYSSGSSGNLNVRPPDGGYLATPTNSCLGELDPTTLSRLNASGTHLSGDKPSREVPMHLVWHRHRPSCGAVMYLHSLWLAALSYLSYSTSEDCLPPLTSYYVVRVGQLPLLSYFKPGHEGTASALSEITADHTAALSTNHGPVVSGRSLRKAVFNAEELEDNAHIWLTLKPFDYVPLSEEVMAELGHSWQARGDTMIPEQRRDFICRYAHEKNTASFNELADLMSVLYMTVCRDIQLLEEEGRVIAINDGVKLNNLLKSESSWREKTELNHDMERKMGQLAATLAEPGWTLYLDVGTSLFEVAKAVAVSHCFNLTVVTNDFSISHCLVDVPHITLYYADGLVDQRNRSCFSRSAISFLHTTNIDVAFLSSSSWDTERGMSTSSEGKALVEEAVLTVSRHWMLVCDNSESGKHGMLHICGLEQLADIISDNRLPENTQQTIVSQGVKLYLVDGREDVHHTKVSGQSRLIIY